MKSREFAVVAEQTEIASGIFSLWLETESIAKEAVPGQFVSVYSKDKSRMLPRPISICEADKERRKASSGLPCSRRRNGWNFHI